MLFLDCASKGGTTEQQARKSKEEVSIFTPEQLL